MPKYYTDQPLPRDKYIPWYFVIAFVLLFALETVLVTTAVKTHPGVVTEKAYEHGLAYNQFIAEQEAQEARGWQGSLHLSGKLLRFELQGRDGAPLTGATVEAEIIRPVGVAYDFTADLKETSPGVYEAELAFPQPGQWKIGVQASWQNQPYRLQQTVFVPR